MNAEPGRSGSGSKTLLGKNNNVPFLPVLEPVLNLVVELVPALQVREVLIEVLVKECVVTRQPCNRISGLNTGYKDYTGSSLAGSDVVRSVQICALFSIF
jgi:hypothetical protein